MPKFCASREGGDGEAFPVNPSKGFPAKPLILTTASDRPGQSSRIGGVPTLGHPIILDGHGTSGTPGWHLSMTARIDTFPSLGHSLRVQTQASIVAALVAEHGDLLTREEAAEFLRVDPPRLRVLALKGIIRRFPVGRAVYHVLADLQAYDHRRKQGGQKRLGRGTKATPVYELAA